MFYHLFKVNYVVLYSLCITTIPSFSESLYTYEADRLKAESNHIRIKQLVKEMEAELSERKKNLPIDPQLNDLVCIALKNNPIILVALKEYQADLQKPGQATNIQSVRIDSKLGQDHESAFVVDIAPGGTKGAQRSVGIHQANASQQKYELSKIIIESKLREEYYNYYFVQKTIQLLKEIIAVLENLKSFAQIAVEQGAIPQSEVFLANLNLLESNQKLFDALIEEKSVRAEINHLIYRDPQTAIGQAIVPDNLFILETSVDELTKLALERHPRILEVQEIVEKNMATGRLVQAQRRPALSIGAGAVVGGPQVILGVLLNSLFRSKPTKAQVEESKKRVEASQADVLSNLNAVAAKVFGLYANVDQTAREKLHSFEDSLKETKKYGDLFKESYQSGNIPYSIYSEAIRLQFDTQLNYARVLSEYYISLAKMERTAGIDIFKTHCK